MKRSCLVLCAALAPGTGFACADAQPTPVPAVQEIMPPPPPPQLDTAADTARMDGR